MEYEIWITCTAWNNGSSGIGYEWELFCNYRSICKSSPTHGDSHYYKKQSAIASARRMRKRIKTENCPIFDVTDRSKKFTI